MVLFVGELALLLGCGSARRTEPIAGLLLLASAELTEGKRLFMRNCDQCHPRGESGLAPALNNKPHPSFLIKFQVRQGLGAMPSFSKEDISDRELENIVLYLQTLRSHR
jgi:mono/diheme cytochrome c family protein